ncbi:organic cation transporter protein-like isoform X2 [Mytilus trossulus]|uniref:organic cation transporter protein-like isoform X2 n=1 Tax=Mytilus trossulus TaxID=6551 RepID=UPI003003AF80
MEYDAIVNKIGGFGKYQKMIIVLLSIAPIFNALTTFAMNFTFGEHEHRCQTPHDLEGNESLHTQIYWDNTSVEVTGYNVTECTIIINGSETKCSSWVYDQSVFVETIISKFDVVCDKKFYRAHFLMSHYLGLLVGSIFTGFLSDTFGRKPLLGFGIALLLISTAVRPMIPSLDVVTIFEFFNGFGSVIYYIVPYILATELVGPKHRLLASFCVYFTFCIGFYILLLLAFFIRNWEHLMFTISVLIGGYIITLFFISESPRWLLSQGKKKEAIAILQKIAKTNGENINLSSEDITIHKEKNASIFNFVKALMKSKILCMRLCIVALNWFALSLTYYGISMNVAKFDGNIYVNFGISSTVETVACFFCLLGPDRFGRKVFFCSSMVIGGLTCFCTIFPSLYASESLSWLTITLAMGGKFFTTIAFFFAYLITAELFPTVLRASALGLCSMSGRIGSITSAYIGELDSVFSTQFGKALPLIIFGAVGLVAGLLAAFALPETVKTLLPESIKDAKTLNNNLTHEVEQEQELDSLKETT